MCIIFILNIKVLIAKFGLEEKMFYFEFYISFFSSLWTRDKILKNVLSKPQKLWQLFLNSKIGTSIALFYSSFIYFLHKSRCNFCVSSWNWYKHHINLLKNWSHFPLLSFSLTQLQYNTIQFWQFWSNSQTKPNKVYINLKLDLQEMRWS